MIQLAELRARVEAATGPDRELDVLLKAMQDGRSTEWEGNTLYSVDEWNRFALGTIDPGRVQRNFSCYHELETPRYTASVDAVLALIEEKLPGWHVRIDAFSTEAFATLFSHDPQHPKASRATGQCSPLVELPMQTMAALALLAALLSALIAQEQTP